MTARGTVLTTQAAVQPSDSPGKGSAHAQVLNPDDLAEIPWIDLHDLPGATLKTLWETPASRAGLMRFEAHVAHPATMYDGFERHVVVMAGSATIAGRQLVAGSYVCIPAGIDSGTTQAGPDGCTLFYHFVGQVGNLEAVHEDGHTHDEFDHHH